MTTLVAVGCSTWADYAFVLPLTALFWRDVVGYETRVFLVGSEENWLRERLTRASLGALREHGIDHRFVAPIEGYEVSTVAQNVRQHAAADADVPGDRWVMMSDADLWPLRRDFYHQHDGSDALAACYYVNGDHFLSREDVLEKWETGADFQSIPTCHVAMRAHEWRSVYDLRPGDVRGSLSRTLGAHLRPRTAARPDQAGWIAWMSDQRILTWQLCRQSWFPDRALLVRRGGHPPEDRLDRGHPDDWRGLDPTRWLDAHVHKGTQRPEIWAETLPLVDHFLPEHAAWARRYHVEAAAG